MTVEDVVDVMAEKDQKIRALEVEVEKLRYRAERAEEHAEEAEEDAAEWGLGYEKLGDLYMTLREAVRDRAERTHDQLHRRSGVSWRFCPRRECEAWVDFLRDHPSTPPERS